MYQAVLFDMDGTVVDTEGIWDVAAKQFLERKGVSLSDEQHQEVCQNMRGASLSDTAFFLKEYAQISDDIPTIVSRLGELAQYHYQEGITYIAGFSAFHSHLQSHAIPTALATNATREMLQATEQALELSQFFDGHMYCVDDVQGVGKPNPDIYIYAAKQIGHIPEQVIVVEDSQTGVQAAKQAGAYCIGINTNGDRKELADADMIVESYSAIDLTHLIHDG